MFIVRSDGDEGSDKQDWIDQIDSESCVFGVATVVVAGFIEYLLILWLWPWVLTADLSRSKQKLLFMIPFLAGAAAYEWGRQKSKKSGRK